MIKKTIRSNKIIENLLVFIVILTSITGWQLLECIGMTFFWGIYLLVSGIIGLLIIKNTINKYNINKFINNKFNIILIVYLMWLSLTYLINYKGITTVLYIFKIWVLITIYLYLVSAHLEGYTHEEKNKFLYKICKWVFMLGNVLSLIGVYQYIQNSNYIFGIAITNWPPYNPASLYGNVNGFGTYLLFSIISGLYCCFTYAHKKFKSLIIFTLTIQGYMLYLTIARTSIISTIVFIILSAIILKINKKKYLKNIFNKRNIGLFILANVVMLSVINLEKINKFVNNIVIHNEINEINEKSNYKEKSNRRSITKMLIQKNEKGVNNRQYIWKAVIENPNMYILFGDGLEYNITKLINVGEVISKRSEGATRISYHNTLFRYFASNGLIGLILFLMLYFYIPLKLLLKMFRQKKANVTYLLVITYLICIFMYMQMEEVYLGEVMFSSINTLIMLAFGNSLLSEKKKQG